MTKRYLTLAADGTLAITSVSGDDTDGSKLTKTLFEQSRTTDLTTGVDTPEKLKAKWPTELPARE